MGIRGVYHVCFLGAGVGSGLARFAASYTPHEPKPQTARQSTAAIMLFMIANPLFGMIAGRSFWKGQKQRGIGH
jgi:hypothetical protein